jgi:excisionase family DNA binding protein
MSDKSGDAPRLLDLARVADRLDVTRETARKLVHSGDLAALRVSNLWRIEPADLARYIASRRFVPSARRTAGGSGGSK